MLSLSVDVDERDASASSSRSRALVLAGGAAEMQHGHLRSLAARQPSVQPSRQARAVQVHPSLWRCACGKKHNDLKIVKIASI